MPLTQAQLDLRASGLGASEAAGALGVSRYATPWLIWARKVGLLPAFVGNWDTRRGDTMEPLMLSWYAEATGAELTSPGTLRHPSLHCILATPDAIAQKAGEAWLVEAKAPSGRTAKWWGEAGTDGIDAEYLPQAVQQMAVTDLSRVDFVVSVAGTEPVVYSVTRRAGLEAKVLGRLSRWWDRHVIGREPPKLDGSEEVRNWLSEQYPKGDGLMLEATPEFESLAEERLRIVLGMVAGKGRKGEIENLTRAVIADAEGIEGSFGKVTWRRSGKTGRRVLRFTYAASSADTVQSDEGD